MVVEDGLCRLLLSTAAARDGDGEGVVGWSGTESPGKWEPRTGGRVGNPGSFGDGGGQSGQGWGREGARPAARTVWTFGRSKVLEQATHDRPGHGRQGRKGREQGG